MPSPEDRDSPAQVARRINNQTLTLLHACGKNGDTTAVEDMTALLMVACVAARVLNITERELLLTVATIHRSEKLGYLHAALEANNITHGLMSGKPPATTKEKT